MTQLPKAFLAILVLSFLACSCAKPPQIKANGEALEYKLSNIKVTQDKPQRIYVSYNLTITNVADHDVFYIDHPFCGQLRLRSSDKYLPDPRDEIDYARIAVKDFLKIGSRQTKVLTDATTFNFDLKRSERLTAEFQLTPPRFGVNDEKCKLFLQEAGVPLAVQKEVYTQRIPLMLGASSDP